MPCLALTLARSLESLCGPNGQPSSSLQNDTGSDMHPRVRAGDLESWTAVMISIFKYNVFHHPAIRAAAMLVPGCPRPPFLLHPNPERPASSATKGMVAEVHLGNQGDPGPGGGQR